MPACIGNARRPARSTQRVVSSVLGLVVALAGSAIGCRPADSTVHLTGSVTYDGQPVPRGMIQFSPDHQEGNSGHGSLALIVDGKYTTRDGLGLVGGQHVVRIQGFDGVEDGDNSDGKPMFKVYQEKLDLPIKSAEFDFDIPAQPKKSK